MRCALRQLAKSPGFTAVAILTLALGIGFSTGSFSMANAFLLRNVPYPDAGEDRPDQPAVAVLTHRAWVNRYASDPAVIGRSIRFNTQPYTIVGVLPPSFEAPLVWDPVEFVIPRTLHPDFRANRKDTWMQAVARLKLGVEHAVSPDYFAALRIPLRQGALFTANHDERKPPVTVVNEAFAKCFWPGENPVGRRLKLGDDERWIEIVGDVGMLGRLSTPETRLQLYRPLLQAPARYLTIALRTAVTPETLTRSVREAVAAIDGDLPVAQPGSLRASYERNLSNVNLVIINLGLPAGMGLLIAGVGLFGVISQLTAQRTRDIGVRIALGAGYRHIMRLVLGEGARLLVVGIVIGVPGYFALTLVLRQALPEMRLPGLWLLAANLAVLSGTMLLACYLPARRAARVDPVTALRAE